MHGTSTLCVGLGMGRLVGLRSASYSGIEHLGQSMGAPSPMWNTSPQAEHTGRVVTL